jgi:hypothetical protein
LVRPSEEALAKAETRPVTKVATAVVGADFDAGSAAYAVAASAKLVTSGCWGFQGRGDAKVQGRAAATGGAEGRERSVGGAEAVGASGGSAR